MKVLGIVVMFAMCITKPVTKDYDIEKVIHQLEEKVTISYSDNVKRTIYFWKGSGLKKEYEKRILQRAVLILREYTPEEMYFTQWMTKKRQVVVLENRSRCFREIGEGNDFLAAMQDLVNRALVPRKTKKLKELL